MTGKTHQIGGIASALLYFLTTLSPSYAPATLGAVLVSSHLFALLPDIDRAGAKFWQSFPGGKLLGFFAEPFLKHRNFTHSLLGVFIIGFLSKPFFFAFPSYWGINPALLWQSSMVAYISHLILDSITAQGIPLLFPYPKMFGFPPRPFDGLRVMTGKWFENFIVFPIFNLGLIAIIVINFAKIKTVIFK